MSKSFEIFLCIAVGVVLIIFRKPFTMLQIWYQQKFNFFKSFLIQKKYTPGDLERKVQPSIELSYVIGAIFFIVFGILALLGVVRIR